MSTEQPVDPQAVEETKQQIRGLVEEISRLTRQDLEPAIFYGEFLQRVVSALAAIGGAVWITSENGPLQLVYQINLRESLPEEQGEDHVRHARLLHRVARNGEELLVPPYSGAGDDNQAGNPTSYLLVLAPLRSEERIEGVVEILQRPTSGPASQRGYLRFLSQMCALAGDYLQGRRLRQLTNWQSLFSQADRFSRTVHESLDPRVTAYTIANEGRRLIGCDRVSVAVRKGNRCVIEAVSGQDTMDTRANSVVLLGKLATAVVRNGEPLWYTGPTDDLPPQIEDAVHAYVDETHSKSVAVLPLRKPKDPISDTDDPSIDKREENEPIAALVVEQIEDNRPPEEFSQSVELVTEHSSRALANAMQHRNLFLMPVWQAIGNARWVVQSRTLPKTLAIAGAALVTLAVLCLWPANFDMKGEGELQPSVRQKVFVDTEGTVTSVKVDSGDTVKKGDILAEMRNTELEVEIERVNGERRTTSAQISTTIRELTKSIPKTPEQRGQLSADLLRYQQKLASLDEELKLLMQKKDSLTVRSPISGQVVTTWTVLQELEQRPVQKGDVLMTVADPNSPWELEIRMAEDRMGHLIRAERKLEPGQKLDVTYVVASEVDRRREGKVRRIDPGIYPNEKQGQSGRLLVDINDSDLTDPRMGLAATAKVHCGRRPIGYVWFHQLIEFVQKRIIF